MLSRLRCGLFHQAKTVRGRESMAPSTARPRVSGPSVGTGEPTRNLRRSRVSNPEGTRVHELGVTL